MADDEVLRRIDRHMERGNELMEHLREVIDGNRAFMRELLLRHEKATDTMITRLREDTRELREHRKEFRQYRDEWREAVREERREFVAEMRAQREALFRMLDKLDGGGQAAGA
jgi:hypothetical protein